MIGAHFESGSVSSVRRDVISRTIINEFQRAEHRVSGA